MPRILTIMGSGETAPTMIKTHRRVMEAVGGGAVLLDTPYGFQENADDISDKAQEFFRQSVGHPIDVASWRHADDDTVTRERALAAIADAEYVFAGPGSPTYALAQWAGSPLPELLAEKLRTGGAVTFASAAALTIGQATVPVYEVYKAGIAPFWAEGLDLLSAIGLPVAVIPHYDNKEGGHHDTRFCYLGERRLSMLEPELPDDAWVLGVDEHTALVIDLDQGTATVEGNGSVTVRSNGESVSFATGKTVLVSDLRPGAAGLVARGTGPNGGRRGDGDIAADGPGGGADEGGAGRAGAGGASADGRPSTGTAAEGESATAGAAGVVDTNLADATARLVGTFDDAIGRRDPDGAVAATLELEQAIVDWSADTLQSDGLDRARAALRRMVVRLGELAAVGAQDPREVVGPYVEAVLAARVDARAAKQYELADQLRDALVDAGVEVRDSPDGTDWVLPT